MRVWIGNTEITKWIADFTDTRNDVEAPDAGRDLSGLMHRGRVTIKKKFQVNCVPMSLTDLTTIENLVLPESFTVRVADNNSTSGKTYNMYSNNVTKQYFAFIGGQDWYKDISFPLIEM